ncbi:MAG TPA: YihY/virulence factor BrkB family protein [Acidocella sp.]|jgi:membrane protein|uniref:YihY/virulence factor BrkB family protein n=1 Tax=Acidocella sp. TaxID=50710 RepID=UPI002C8709D0|nr:YihY/virulence factor BrkB family protein [Acidocella sp.]HVE20880.1 YihY/virulence factor BrkB family protein [Acidocella sp.]
MIGQLLRRNKIPLIKRAVIAAGRATSSQGVSLAAAGCAFYATLALFPSITMLISLYGLAYNPDTVQPQLHYLRHFMPPAAFVLISERIQSLVSQPARGLGISFLISLALSLWSSAAGTTSVLNALSLAYKQDETRGFFRFQLVSLGMTFIAVLGTALAIGVLVLIPIIVARVGLSAYARGLVVLPSFAVMIVFATMALGLLYRYGPAGAGRIFYAPGAGLATVIWLLGSWAFGLYVGRFAAYSVTYGPLSTIIGLMMWFYLTAYSVLFGAEVNAALDAEWRREEG